MTTFASCCLASFASKSLRQRCSHSNIFATTVHLLPRDLRMVRNMDCHGETKNSWLYHLWEVQANLAHVSHQPCFTSMVIEHFYSNRRGKWPEHLTSTKGFKYLALESKICYEYYKDSAEPLHPCWMALAARLLKYKLPVTVWFPVCKLGGEKCLFLVLLWESEDLDYNSLVWCVLHGRGNSSAEL